MIRRYFKFMSLSSPKFAEAPGGRSPAGAKGEERREWGKPPLGATVLARKKPRAVAGLFRLGRSLVRSHLLRLLRLSGDTATAALSCSPHLRTIAAGGDAIAIAGREFLAGPSHDGRG